MSTNIPVISVIMPVYNCKEYVHEAVESILNQTFSNFELLIIDDASTDGTANLLKKYKDPRIKFLAKQQNTGYTNSLNWGLTLVRGQFIARMDGDDVSLPNRFQKQLDYFETNPDIIVCGSNYQIIGSNKTSSHPGNSDLLKVSLLEGCYIAHPTVMIRARILTRYQFSYDPSLEPAEDYNLWVHLAKYGAFGNIEESLIKYRVHQRQISLQKRSLQKRQADKARIKMIQLLLPDIKNYEQKIHLALMKSNVDENIAIETIEKWTNSLISANCEKRVFNHSTFITFLEKKKKQYVQVFFSNQKKTWKLLYNLYHPKGAYFRNLPFHMLLKLNLKYLIFSNKNQVVPDEE